jgi:periplasmic mercuric ion binding protein
MRFVILSLAVMAIGIAGPNSPRSEAADQQITLMLGGSFCEFYPKDITDALMKVKGVTEVDLKSMKGHAIVSHDGTAKSEDLVAAVNDVKGEKMGIKWYCTAEVMK